MGYRKPKLDNASKFRGISFIDPPDEQFKQILKTARSKLEVPMPAAMLYTTRGGEYRETCIGYLQFKYTASLKPTSLRESVWKELFIKVMKMNSLKNYNLVHNFFLSQAIQYQHAQKSGASRTRGAREHTSMAADESEKQKRGDR